MRDVNPLAALHASDLRPRILEPERFRPKPRLRAPIPSRVGPDGTAEIRLGDDRWQELHPFMVEVHRCLEDDLTVEEMVARVVPVSPRPDPRTTERIVRDYLLQLSRLGMVDLPFEPPPAAFAGRYERVKELGRGGIGVVHLCRDRETGREVVVKHAWGWKKDIAMAEKHMRTEAIVFAALDHPAFPKVHDTFEDRGTLHLVREAVDGTPLDGLEKEAPAWPSMRRRRIVARLADAFHHLHDRGFLCLDIKTGNVLLTADDDVRVFDLGTCRPNEGILQLRKPTGTPGYAAPEMKRERRADVRTDVYSLGAVLYALAFGRRPKRTWSPPELPASLRSAGVDEEEVALVARMTAADPADRFQDLAEARDALLG